jgi:putative endonuclease
MSPVTDSSREVDQDSRAWSVYLLACAGGKCYVGISPRPEERFAAHCAGRGGAFTRANPPLQCVRIVWFDGRRAAASLEVRLKSATRERKLRWFEAFPHTTPQQASTLDEGLARLRLPVREVDAPSQT